MSKKRRFPWLFLLFTLSCCVCVVVGISLLPRATALMAQLSLPMIETYSKASPRSPDAVVLASDDFSNPQSGWKTGSWSNGQVEYSNGGYRMSVTDTNVYAYLEHRFPADVSIEVDVETKRDAEVFFGVTCRDQNDTGYELTFGGSKAIGTASPSILSKSRDGLLPMLEQQAHGDLFFWPQDWQGEYHLRADCIDDQLALYVNGYLVQKVSDSKYKGNDGRIGLFGGHVNGANATYLFDNFIVYQP